ncbi:hypothetical protein [Streptomyces sp. NPDC091371]|uniref:hypothetical protein n=1 Tax=Streptomyces sp. NPDC091371 TaxID=3155303 RepID=UPI0034188992
MMRRSVPVIATLVLLFTAVGCRQQSDAKAPAESSAAGPSASARPLSADEARRIVEEANKRADAESEDPDGIARVAEGPWKEQLLAIVDNGRKHGTSAPPGPTNSPATSPTVRAWAGSGPDGNDRWVLGAYETASTSVGEEQRQKKLLWALYHEGADGVWRMGFTAYAPSSDALPQLATGPDGQVVTGGDASKLGADPATVCGRYDDYWTGTSGPDAAGTVWSAQIDAVRAKAVDRRKNWRRDYGNPASFDFSSEPTRTPYGPLWRTSDGGALVACVSRRTTAIDMGPGRYQEFDYSGWTGTTGIRWNTYTQTQLGMTVLKVPAGAGEVSVAAEVSWPYKFDGTRYNGN